MLTGGILLCSCSVKVRTSTQVSQPASLSADGKLWSSLWQQKSAEYKALCFQAYNIARLRLDDALKNTAGRPLAVVTDIDETALDNSPNAVSQALAGKDYEREAWHRWTDKASADTVPGAASFFRYAASKGVSVFYVTNRDEQERASTLKNLERYAFPFADAEHLLLKKETSGKEARRQQVLQGHDIVLLIGDNLSDFSNLFDKLGMDAREKMTKDQASQFGKKFIVLPNSTYGDWEGAIYNYDYGQSNELKEKTIKQILKKE